MNRAPGRLLLTTCLLVLSMWPAANAWAAPEEDVLTDVLRMLDEGVASAVIVEWVSQTGRPVRRLGPDDMIALSKAGASAELVQLLLEQSSRTSAPVPTPAPTPEPGRTADPPDAPRDGLAGVAITLHYKSQLDSGSERNMRWAMLAYLDGEPLIWSTSRKEAAKTSRRIAPGRHVVHVLRESHLDWKKGWRHESYVNLAPIEFTLEPGEGWHLSIDWVVKSLRFSDKGPLSWSLSRWSAGIAGEDRIGMLLDEWPRLCEDVEANAPEGKKTPGWIKRDLKGCVRWSDLWADVPGAPDRAVVRQALEAVAYRPPLI